MIWLEPDQWWNDYSGRFTRRPFFRDARIEAIALKVANEYIDDVTWPLTDDQIDFLADMLTVSYDRSRDLKSFGPDVEAVTIFSSTGLPRIVLSNDLGAANLRQRRRMTVAHELGHVVLHQPLYARDERQLNLIHEHRSIPAYCHDAMSTASVDWCEWQASYFAGALLAPKKHVICIVTTGSASAKPVKDASADALQTIAAVASHFDISKPAARVRLAQIGLILPQNNISFDLSPTA